MPSPRLPRLASLVVGPFLLAAMAPAHAVAEESPLPKSASGTSLSNPSGNTSAGAPAPVVTMPVPKKNEGAAYPKEALDEGFYEAVDVSVIVTVGVSGDVKNARVEKPVGHGFDEAAVTAAQAMQFEPATRDGKPVAASTRILFRFSPPLSVLKGQVITEIGGRPIAGATVTVRDATGTERTETAGADGSWQISGLPRGRYHITVTAPGMIAHEADEDLLPGEEVNASDRLSREAKPAPTSGAAADDAEQVEVRGTKPPREVVKRTLEQRELDRIPGTGGDALKSLQNLPGVARTPSLSGLLVVRGAAPQDSLYFVDGTPIPIVYHFGGLYSVLPTEVIDRIDFYPGNFSTQFGRAMGAIIDVGLATPKADKLHAMVEANLIDARFIVQGPVFDTGWRFSVGGRRSYVDTWLGPVLTAAGANVSVAPVYYDYQAVLERDLGKQSSLRFAFFGSDDRLALLLTNASADNPTLAGSLSTHTGFWRAQGLYKAKLSDSTEFRLVSAVGQDFVDFSVSAYSFHLTTWPITGRAEVAQKLDTRLTMNVGLDVIYTPYTLSAVFPPLPRPGQPPPGPFSGQVPLSTHNNDAIYRPAFYAEWEATPFAGTRIVPGLRLDYSGDTQSWDFDPRVVARQDITTNPRTTLKAGVGLFSQPPQPQETNAVFGMKGLTSNRAFQYDVGVEHQFTPHIEATVDAFYKQLDHLVTQGLGNTGTGVIYGAEALLRYTPDKRFFGWLSYTLSRSTRRDAPGMPLLLSLYDETHVLAVLGSYRLGHGWEFGARFRLTSGFMYTPETYGFYDENVGTYVPLQAYPQNGSRLPLFTSLDLRVDKSWPTSWGKVSAYLDVLNVYNNANVDGISYDFNYTHTSYANDLPILPSLGVRVDL